ncbi:MAG: hypothetical protein NTW87_36790 [Planctomycetota bacterium]|nr:hypothetical protein [Planctomycetota bacterium]
MNKRLSASAMAGAILIAFLISGCGGGDTGTSSSSKAPDAASSEPVVSADDVKWAYREAVALGKEMKARYDAAREGQPKVALWRGFGPEVSGGMSNEDVKDITEGMAQYYPDNLARLAALYEKGEPNGPHAEDFKKLLADPEFPRLREIKEKIRKTKEEQKLLVPNPKEIAARMQYDAAMALLIHELLPMIEDEKAAPRTLSADQRKEALDLYQRIQRLDRAAIDVERMSQIQFLPPGFERQARSKAMDHTIEVLKPELGLPKTKR